MDLFTHWLVLIFIEFSLVETVAHSLWGTNPEIPAQFSSRLNSSMVMKKAEYVVLELKLLHVASHIVAVS